MGNEQVPIIAALISRYKGMVVLVSKDKKIYIGRQESYHVVPPEHIAYYDNSDGSLRFVSTNQKMFHFLGYGDGYIYSQKEMMRRGYHSESDYKEYAALQKDLLSDFTMTKEIDFDGTTFMPPEELPGRRKKGVPSKPRNKSYIQGR